MASRRRPKVAPGLVRRWPSDDCLLSQLEVAQGHPWLAGRHPLDGCALSSRGAKRTPTRHTFFAYLPTFHDVINSSRVKHLSTHILKMNTVKTMRHRDEQRKGTKEHVKTRAVSQLLRGNIESHQLARGDHPVASSLTSWRWPRTAPDWPMSKWSMNLCWPLKFVFGLFDDDNDFWGADHLYTPNTHQYILHILYAWVHRCFIRRTTARQRDRHDYTTMWQWYCLSNDSIVT